MVKNKFLIPKVISFDAFGTLYTPKVSVSQQYTAIARNYIPDLKPVSESAMIDAIKSMRLAYPNYGKHLGMTQEQWWSKVIQKVFTGYSYDESMTKHLIDHFVDSELYHLFEDVEPLLVFLQNHGVKLIICSNSDDRLKQVIKSLGLSRFFSPSDIYLSYDLDCSKPDPRFFDKVRSDLCSRYSDLRDVQLNSPTMWWHCGDDYKKDYQYALQYGLQGVLLDRNTHSTQMDSNNGITVPSLQSMVSIWQRG